eukprot:6280958-Alexandrium_andersonii.AAC.1
MCIRDRRRLASPAWAMASIARSSAAPPVDPSGPRSRSRSGQRWSMRGPAEFQGPGLSSTSPSSV